MRRPRILTTLVTSIALGCGGMGCVTGSLASSSGPRGRGQQWSTAREQSAHVGEAVRFDFVLKNWNGALLSPSDVGDYCVFTIGDAAFVADAEPSGHFSCNYRFDAYRSNDTVGVAATAYRRHGARDWTPIHGRWVRAEIPGDPADSAIASDQFQILIYKTTIHMEIPSPADDLDGSTGLLRLSTENGRTMTFPMQQDRRPGFRLDGQKGAETYHLTFEPPAEALAATGQTNVTFTIKDRAGETHIYESSVDSP